MDWFLYDNGLRHERVNKVDFFDFLILTYHIVLFNPFLASVTILYPLKTQEGVFWCFTVV